MNLRASVALIDIEGTVGSIAFVRDVLFPYAEKHMNAYVTAHLDDPHLQSILHEAALEAGVDLHDLNGILTVLHQWAAEDLKVTPLKQLQGLIWVEGFESSGIRGHLYDDAIEALRRFNGAGVKLYVYSSGSVPAQKLLFGHSVAGNLLPLFSGFFDTTIGGKRARSSYETIAREIAVAPGDVVFFSDNAHELDAAREAGMQTVQLARPDDNVERAGTHASVATFEGVEINPR
jgi:enolase-phosphatase E1